MAGILSDIAGALGLTGNGEVSKLTIHSWDKVSRDEKGNIIRPTDIATANAHFEAFINPDEFTINYRVQQDHNQPLGSTGSVGTFLGVYPIELTVKFYLDGTKAIGKEINAPEKTVSSKINEFYNCVGFSGEQHATKYLVLQWGKLSLLRNEPDVLYCCLQSASIQYKMFNTDGTPLRAIINATFIEVGDYVKIEAEAQKKSADLTHMRVAKEGDTLPALVNEIYGNFKYYVEVAKVNNLQDFRNIQPGQKLFFPPFDKNVNLKSNA